MLTLPSKHSSHNMFHSSGLIKSLQLLMLSEFFVVGDPNLLLLLLFHKQQLCIGRWKETRNVEFFVDTPTQDKIGRLHINFKSKGIRTLFMINQFCIFMVWKGNCSIIGAKLYSHFTRVWFGRNLHRYNSNVAFALYLSRIVYRHTMYFSDKLGLDVQKISTRIFICPIL